MPTTNNPFDPTPDTDATAEPALDVQRVTWDTLTPNPHNPRNGDIEAITESVRLNGVYRPIVVAQDDTILAGHHLWHALGELGHTHVDIVRLPIPGDSPEATRIMLADNRTADLGRYDDALLLDLIQDLDNTHGLDGTGYTPDDLTDLAALLETQDDTDLNLDTDDNRAPTTGERLATTDVTWGDPHHRVHHGDIWTLGRHTLVIARLHDEHHLWTPHLTPAHVFAPYPEPYLTTSTLAHEHPLLLVQPNTYLAGHLIDKHASAFPDEPVTPATSDTEATA